MSAPVEPADPAEPVYAAVVIWYDRLLGYGFMALEGYNRDVLVHNKEVRKADLGRDYLLKGDSVRCKVGLHRGRPCCTDLEQVELRDTLV